MSDIHPSALAPRRLATLPDILAALTSLQSHESELTSSLSDLLSASEPISVSLSGLKALGPQLDILTKETHLLEQTVSYTARTAQDVGGRVQSLDEEMKRVREASERVGQIIELKVRVPLTFDTRLPTFLPVFSCCAAQFNRATGLGVGHQALCAGHGPPLSRDLRSFRGDGCGTSLFFLYPGI